MATLRRDAISLAVGVALTVFGLVVTATGIMGRADAALLRLVGTPGATGPGPGSVIDVVAYLAIPSVTLVALVRGRRRLAAALLGAGVATWVVVHAVVGPAVSALADAAVDTAHPPDGIALITVLVAVVERGSRLGSRVALWTGVVCLAVVRLRGAVDLPSGVVAAVGIGLVVARLVHPLVGTAVTAPARRR